MTEFKGTREAFAAAVMDMAETDERIVVVSPDSLKAMRAVPEKNTPAAMWNEESRSSAPWMWRPDWPAAG